MKKCSVEGCNCKHVAKGYCRKHYAQVRRYGKILERTIYDSNEIIEYDDHAEIVLYNKYCEEVARALVDLEDVDIVKDYKWTLDNSVGYVLTGIKGTTNKVSLHRLIMNPDDNMVVDHINHNKLDNRKSNLRICTQQQNNINTSLKKTNTSGITGVSWDKSRNKWVAHIKGKQLGRFNTKEEAIEARKQAELEYFGEYRNKEDEE